MNEQLDNSRGISQQ